MQTDQSQSSGDRAGGEESESEEQYLIRTQQVGPGHPNYLRTLRLSSSHEVILPSTAKTCLCFGKILVSSIAALALDTSRLAACRLSGAFESLF